MVLKTNKCIPVLSGVVLALVVTMGMAREVVAAGPLFWDWPKVQSFVGLELNGTTVNAQGYLTGAMAATSYTGEGPEVYWGAISDGRGGYFTGTGHGGKILRTDPKGTVSVFAELEGTEVFSLLLLEDGSLMAGCGPEGEVYRITPEGKSRQIGVIAEGYAWAMVQDERSGNIYIAAGSPAAVYRVDAKDALEKVWEFSAQNALDITMSARGEVLVATQGPGCVYLLDASFKKSRLLLEMDQDEARQFISGPAGALFVVGFHGQDQDIAPKGGLAPGGEMDPAALLSLLVGDSGPTAANSVIYQLEEDGSASLVWSSQNKLMIASWDENLGWLGGGELDDESGQSILYALDFPAGEHPLARWSGGDILDILVTGGHGSDADLIVCQAFPGSVTALSSRGDRSHFATSTPLDGGKAVTWGRLSWDGISGKGKLRWSVRGGNSSEPDDSWSSWSNSWTGDSHGIDLKPCRYLQWRVEFPQHADLSQSWLVTGVSVSAWLNNSAPVIAKFGLEQLVSIEPGGMLGGSENVTQFYRSGLFAEFSRTARGNDFANPALVRMSRPVHVFSWKATDAEDDRLLFTLQYRQVGSVHWRDVQADSPETLGSWDTSELKDGQYEVRLRACDSRDNPDHLAMSTMKTLGPFKVDNQPPVIDSFKLEQDPAGFRVRFKARDENSHLAAATILLPDGTFERLDPRDGICDSNAEEFDAVIVWPRAGTMQIRLPGPWVVGIGVQDLAGNRATAEGEIQ